MSTATIDSTVADRMRAHREQMVAWHLESRGIHDETVLKAMREVPREEFVPHDLIEYAYEDSSLPIDEQQTISQPYIVALMAQALELGPGDRVLEVGSGSGYAAAILGRIAGEVFTIEWYASLAASAAERCSRLGYANVHVRQGDGTLGWPEEAPFDAIAVAAGGPEIPRSLLAQLAVGGRLVIPVGPTPRLQSLVRVRRTEQGIETENLGGVAFVPLVGAEGWTDTGERRPRPSAVMPDPRPVTPTRVTLAGSVAKAVEPLDGIWEGSLVRLMERIGDARIVCLGEASHGTAEFYDMRTRITRELVERKGFTIVAVEADWPDARQIDGYVRDTWVEPGGQPAFQRFPTWMWANGQVLTLLYWMREYNESVAERDRSVGFYGLDLYSLYNSIDSVVRYLDDVDPEAARVARHRYGCLSPWQGDPAAYGAAATSGRYEACEQDVVQMLRDLLEKRFEYTDRDGERFLDAAQNARLITNAERYYRTMYRGGRASWNLRDTHMFDTLETLLRFRGPDAGAVVWAHNSHLGDASATEMGAGGQINVGQLCRERFGSDAYLIGFGTDHGTVAAATDWGGPMEIKQVRPSHEQSYERVCLESEIPSFLLPLREGEAGVVRARLLPERLERAIGVIYRPETEIQSHYFYASLPRQFDEYIWVHETRAVDPLTTATEEGRDLPETFPFGL
jgi:protein-L-isoaspartate(D-aspartate) O-methyltransferase